MTYYDLNMNNKRITACLDPSSSQDVATKNYVDTTGVTSISAGTNITVTGTTTPTVALTNPITTQIDMGGLKIVNCANPTTAQDVATKNYVDTTGVASISTNAPLIDDYSAGSNTTISINFTTKYGEIPYGIGTAETGALLAPPTDSQAVGKVLTYTGIVSGQPAIGWETPASPSGDNVVVVHSSAASISVPVPENTNQQLVIVAENIGSGSWDGNNEYGTNLELWMEQIPSSGPPLRYLCKAVADGPTGRHVDLLNISLGQPEYLGTFSYVYSDGTGDNAVVNCYSYGRTTAGVIFEGAGGVFSGGLVIGGRFNRYLPSGSSTPIVLSNICLLTGTGASGGTIIRLPCSTDPSIDSYPGLINDTGVNDERQQVCSITAFDGGTNTFLGANPGLLITGEFDTLQTLSGTTTTNTKGLVNIAIYTFAPSAAFSFVTVPNTLTNGFALGGSVPGAAGGAVGQVRCACFNLPVYSIIYFGGDGLTTAIFDGDPTGATTFGLPANCEGFAVYDYTNSPAATPVNNWGINALPGVTPGFQTAGLYSLAASVTLANTIIGLGVQSLLVNISNPFSFVYNQLGVNGVTPVCPGWPNTGVYGFFNAIFDTHFDDVGGQVVGDCCVFSTALTPASNGEQYVCYFSTAGGTTPINILPSPCGPLSPLIAGEQCRFGITADDPSQNPPPVQPIISGTSAPGGFYLYIPSPHAVIDFVTKTPCVFRPPTGGTFTTAQFTTSFQSQSYISSSDKSAWIQLGPTNANIAYS